jgi:hypothetical protein
MFRKEVIRFARKEIVPRVEEHDLKGTFDFEAFRKMGDVWPAGPAPARKVRRQRR